MEATFYSQNPKFYVSVDCVIFCFENNELKVLLQKRNFEPFKGELTLMGGFVQENEDPQDTAYRVLEERTGINNIIIDQVGTFGAPDRDPGARVITIGYSCLVDKNLCNSELNHQHYGFWVNVYDLPELSFGHNEIIDKALNMLRMKIGKVPVGFQLLPELFTLTQLQSLHEAILNEPLDKRNFRKKIAELTYIIKTNKKDKIHSKRGAALYYYNQDVCRNLFKENF